MKQPDCDLNRRSQHRIMESFPRPAAAGGCADQSLEHKGPSRVMKAKTRHRKSYKWRKRCDSSPIAKGRRARFTASATRES